MLQKWKVCSYDDLSKQELHQLMILRQNVFIVEQNCPYKDADNKDFNSHHLMRFNENTQIIAYLRIVAPGISYKEVSLGRIVTDIDNRGTGLGIELMKMGLQFTESIYGKVDIRISAQTHLVPFYKKFDFESTGKQYLEDDIPHTEMIRY
jgi:ElaA protein|tara:strand:+ start:51 stop:500 length:450 start_codon:yes stop_codon:yes gene_type:complete